MAKFSKFWQVFNKQSFKSITINVHDWRSIVGIGNPGWSAPISSMTSLISLGSYNSLHFPFPLNNMFRFKLSSNSVFRPYVSRSSRIEEKHIHLLFKANRPGSKGTSRSAGGVTAKAFDGCSSRGAHGIAVGSVKGPTAPSLCGKPHVCDCDCGSTWLFKASEIARQVLSNPTATLSFLVAESHTLSSIWSHISGS